MKEKRKNSCTYGLLPLCTLRRAKNARKQVRRMWIILQFTSSEDIQSDQKACMHLMLYYKCQVHRDFLITLHIETLSV
jgi:hypothetical protein